MVKKICSIFIAIVCCISFALPISAEQNEHQHDWVAISVDKPYCGHDGYTVYKCSVCQEEKTETIPMQNSEHEYELTDEVPLNCETTDGVKTYTCKYCADVQTEVVEHSGAHITEIQNAKEATCTEDGYTGDEVCTVCGVTVTQGEIIDSLGHKTEIRNAKEPTCTEKGYTGDEYCTVCDELVKSGEEIPALGHITELKDAKDATCIEKGYTGDKVCSVCGKVIEEGTVIDVDLSAHVPSEAVLENIVDPTCTEDGSYDSVVYCSVCEEELSRENIVVDALGHTWDEGVVTTEPTCTKEGVKTYTCTECSETKTEVIPFAAHTYKKTAEQIDATCTESGKTETYECEVCGNVFGGETIPAKGHSWNDGEVTTEPTCTEAGVRTYTCEECGATKTEEIEALGHQGKVTKEGKPATCTETGLTDEITCERCGTVLQEQTEIEAKGHDFDYEHQQVTEATCTTDGKVVTVCKDCGETMESVISALGHNKDIVVEAKESTCTERGNKTYYRCSRCNLAYSNNHNEWESNIDEYLLQLKPHTFEDIFAKHATCTEEGSLAGKHCTVCDQYFKEDGTTKTTKEALVISALGHSTEIKNAKDATCTEDGYTGDEVCKVCGEVLAEGTVIPAFGHTYKETTKIEPTCTEIGYQYYVCETCGIEKVKELAKTEHDYDIDYSNDATCTKDGTIIYTCKNCGDTVSYKVPAKGHTESEAVLENIVDPTCTQDGSYDSVVYCSVCGAEISRETVTVPATGHQETEIKNAKDATCTEEGYTGDEVCTVCGEVLVAGEAIPALGHTTELVNVKDATCTETGYTGDKVCTVCGETVETGSVIPALGHKWELDPSKSVAATAESEGKEVYYCPVCGETYEKTLPKTTHENHHYVVTERKAETCTEDGYVVYECDDCHKTYTEKIKATGHQETEIKNAKDATCTEEGYTGDEVCTVCGETVEKGSVILALGHTLVTKNSKKATYFAKGYTGDKVCSVCGEVIEKGKAIAKLKLTTPKITLKAGKKSFKVTYNKVKDATGFQVRYKLSGKWTVKTFNSKKTATKTIKKLKKGKKYKVQVRAFIKQDGMKAYSSWTKTKKAKIK